MAVGIGAALFLWFFERNSILVNEYEKERTMNIQEQSKKALWQAYGRDASRNGYVPALKDNLLAGVRIKDFEKDLESGSGKELGGKILAIHSSSALVVNCFSRFKSEQGDFQMGTTKGSTLLAFERKLPTGLKGISPNLDVWVESKSGNLAIESKLLEYLSPKVPKFSASYERLEPVTSNKQLWKLYRKTVGGKLGFLDRAQLIKHCFGISALMKAGGSADLVYLYWEPKNAEKFAEFKRHRAEVAEFAKALEGSSIRFISMSYPELWSQWERKAALKEHAAMLKARYEVTI